MMQTARITKPVQIANAAARIFAKDPNRARKLIEAGLAEFPGHPLLVAGLAKFESRPVPLWHFGMMKDVLRNRAYEMALVQLIRPGMRVFEIGTGAGLLAMMAARAGAQKVITCESDARVAEVAEEIVRHNGFSETVSVIPKKSTELTAQDTGGRFDLLLTETFDSVLVGEGALASIKHARQNLLHDHGIICPMLGRINAQLVRRVNSSFDLSANIEGFDMSGFSEFAPKVHLLKTDSSKVKPIGAPKTIVEFDFLAGYDLAPQQLTTVFDSGSEPFDGLAIWIALELAPGVHYECPPGSGVSSHWGTIFVLKPESLQDTCPRAVRLNFVVDVDIFHAWFDET